jgi:hypothetical protein
VHTFVRYPTFSIIQVILLQNEILNSTDKIYPYLIKLQGVDSLHDTCKNQCRLLLPTVQQIPENGRVRYVQALVPQGPARD